MPLFALATLLPAALIAAAAIMGGGWAILALLSVTALVMGLDRLVVYVTPPQDDREFPVADGLLVVLALVHFVLLVLCVRAFGSDILTLLDKAVLLMATGLYFGQVSNSNAHELIHKGRRWMHNLGMWVYISLLFGHHTSAHVLVHHRNVATPDDPNTARMGESYYHYVLRAWRGSFMAGLEAETLRLKRVDRGRIHNPYVIYVGGSIVMLILATSFGGLSGLVGYVLLAVHAQSQLLLSDYVQHYGLVRHTLPSGKPEPVSARHSWNAPHWYSSAMMLNAPRHSDHHAHPMRPYPALRLPPDAPMLPRSLPVMAALALVPPAWRRVMNRRAREWQ